MSSIWSSAAIQGVTSPFATTGTAPKPGSGAAARFQSLLSSNGQTGKASSPLGLSPGATTQPNAAASSSSSDSSASITANDFLTLLVTEMQNQDPTAQTDPNAYVDQLVQINSLEQLISMNQNLALVLGTVTSPVPTGGGSTEAASTTAVGTVSAATAAVSERMPSTASPVAVSTGSTQHASTQSNLRTASHTVARALDGHISAATRGHGFRDIPTR